MRPAGPLDALSCNEDTPDPGPNPLRRLTPTQYLNSVRDLLGEVNGLEAALAPPAEASELGLIQPDVAPVELENYQAAAELVAKTVVSDEPRLRKLLACQTNAEPSACARTFTTSFTKRAYRAPLEDAADLDRHLALYDLGAKTSHAHGIELVLRAVLQAPRFLYRVELGTTTARGDDAIALSDHELAARLSYAFWDSVPDESLTTAADGGELSGTDGLHAALQHVLTDKRGTRALARFLERWLRLSQLDTLVKDQGLFPDWSSGSLPAAVRGQAQAFLDNVLAAQGGSLRALLTSQTVLANKALAPYYDVSGLGDAFEAIAPDEHAAGVLTLPAFLALTAKPAESSPIYRGKFVREALLCQTLPAPPPNIPKPPEVSAGVSTRERLAQHEVDPACSGCHRLMDPIGFGFEHFDAIGRYRASDGGDPVDARGEVVATRDLDGAFDGVRELAGTLANSAEVRECMVRQWFRFALARFERDADSCSMRDLLTRFEEHDSELGTLPEALVDSASFRYRRPIAREEQP